jgi:hypothetical protein
MSALEDGVRQLEHDLKALRQVSIRIARMPVWTVKAVLDQLQGQRIIDEDLRRAIWQSFENELSVTVKGFDPELTDSVEAALAVARTLKPSGHHG